jgi:hypothetical protein
MDGTNAYMNLRAEKEAYENHYDINYLPVSRKRWDWIFCPSEDKEYRMKL